MRGSRKFYQRGSNFDKVDEGREDPSPTISGPSSARQRNAIWAFHWHADECPTLNADFAAAIFQGIRTC